MRFTTFRVFVYGSLLRKLHNHGWLDGARFLCRTTMEGARYTMLDLGSFPALVPAEAGFGGATDIVGELYEVDHAGLMALDRLEGTANGFYRRDRVLLAGPGSLQVNVYVMVRKPWQPVDRSKVVSSGDWRAHLATRDKLELARLVAADLDEEV